MRVALIQSEDRRDRRALHAARALRRRGHEVTIVSPLQDVMPSTPAAAFQWYAEGFAWLPVNSALVEPPRQFPCDHGLATARRLWDVITTFDAAWFFERHWAMPALQNRRFRDRLLPLILLESEPDLEMIPTSLAQLNRIHYGEYAARWADGAFSAQETDVEGSVRRLEALWRERTAAPIRQTRTPATSPAVTVCIPYFEAAAFLPETLKSLERQTSNNFTVVVVDDGSYTEQARRAFDECAALYAARGWKFVRQANRYPGAARNRGARESNTEFLIFFDSDDIAMPALVEHFLRAALLSGDDCLAVPQYGFRQNPEGPFELLYIPPGNSLVGSIADDMYGGSCMIVKREAFWSVGGFTEIRGVGHEDYEFHVRCNLAGLRCDVLPEFFLRYRMPPPANVSRSTPAYANAARVHRWYEQRLRGSGLEQLPSALGAAYRRNEAWNGRSNVERTLAHRLQKPPVTRGLRLLVLTCYFPFGVTSGWHKRVRELIRYFGSRYELTLVAPMDPVVPRRVQKEAFRYLRLVRGVEFGQQIPVGEDLPYRVRERYLDSMRSALRAMPTEQYHAALIDQIFMAEFRHDIETVPVLTEHNIESRLLRQAAAHSWDIPLPDFFRDPALEAEKLARYEDHTWPDFPLRAVPSELDRMQMDCRCTQGKTVVAANGADPSDWLRRARHDTETVLFAAHLGYLPNVDAVHYLAEKIWPEVRRRKPNARLIVAGRDPHDSLRAIVRSTEGAELIANPKSMKELATRASLTVAPLRLGSGTRYKILESMSWGLPVVSTTLGCEGIDVLDGEHLLVRDDPQEFAEAIVRLMSDTALWRRLRHLGSELVRERYSWDRVFEPLEIALIELVS